MHVILKSNAYMHIVPIDDAALIIVSFWSFSFSWHQLWFY